MSAARITRMSIVFADVFFFLRKMTVLTRTTRATRLMMMTTTMIIIIDSKSGNSDMCGLRISSGCGFVGLSGLGSG